MKFVLSILAVLMSLITLFGVSQTISVPDMVNLFMTLVCAAASFALWKGVFRMKEKKARKKVSGKAAAPAAKPVPKPSSAPQPSVVTMLSGEQPAKAPAPAPAVRTSKKILRYEGKIVGTSFDGRQGILARLMKKEEEGEAIDFFLEERTYKGKPSIKVMAEIWGEDTSPKHIGFIASKDVDKVLPLIDTADVDVELYGGLDAGYDFEEGSDYNYGAAISLYTEA